MPRNLYNDNIQDVFSIDDLESLKENGYMNVLAHQDDYVMIEAGKDFWKIDTEKGVVTQYKDYLSLQNNTDGELVYSKEYPALNRDYGAVLYDAVKESDYKNLPKFPLQERKDYFENSTKGLVKNKMKGEFEQALKNNRKEAQEFSSNLTESVNKPETKFIADSIKIATDLMSIFFTFLKNNVDKDRREKFLKDIVEKLDKGELDPIDVKILAREYPELEKILHQWQKGKMGLNLETSTTVDKALESQINQQSNNNITIEEQPKLQPTQTISIGEGERKEETLKIFNPDNTEFLLKQTNEEMEQMYGLDFKEKMQELFRKSGSDDPINYSCNLLDDKILEELRTENPDINKVDCAKAIAYINHLIEDGNNDSEQILMEKMSDNSLGTTNDKTLFNIINSMIKRGEELVNQQQRKQTYAA